LRSGGLPGRFEPRRCISPKRGADIWPRRPECRDRPCHLGRDGAEEFVLWGDSHAEALAPELEAQAVSGEHHRDSCRHTVRARRCSDFSGSMRLAAAASNSTR
jgi:hypothetical protein